jgi:hypothetical protein
MTATDTIDLSNERRQVTDATGTLDWSGPPDAPAFLLTNVDGREFNRHRLVFTRPAVSAFDVTRSPDERNPDGYTPTACKWYRTEIDSREDGCRYGWRVSHKVGGGDDRNNDCHTWEECKLLGMKAVGWLFEGTQSMQHTLIRCTINGTVIIDGRPVPRTKHAVVHTDNYTVKWIGGGGAWLTDYVFVFGQRGGGVSGIEGGAWENMLGGFVRTIGSAVTPVNLRLSDIRFNHQGPKADPQIDIARCVPAVSLDGGEFSSMVPPDEPYGPTRWAPIVFRFDAHPRANTGQNKCGSVRVRDVVFMQPHPLPAPKILVSQSVADVDVRGCQLWAQTHGAGPFVYRGMVSATPF